MQLLRLASFLPSGMMVARPFLAPFSACQALPVGHLEPCGQNNLLLINCAGQAGRLGRGSALDAR